MVLLGGVHKIIFLPNLAYGACLKERVLLKIGALYPVGDYVFRLLLNGEHIVLQNHGHGTHNAVLIGVFQYLLTALAEHIHFGADILLVGEILPLLKVVLGAVINSDNAVVVYDPRVEADVLFHGSAVLVAHKAEILVLSCRSIADGDAYGTEISSVSVPA